MRKTVHVSFLSVVVLLAYSPLHAAPVDLTIHAQDYFSAWAKNNNITGAALAINQDIYFYGYSDKKSLTRVNSETEFGIGSITKTFVSVILLKLEAAGKVNIHDPITRYLPQYTKLKNVTIKQLMQMNAGFNDVGNDSISPLEQIEKAYKKYDPKSTGTWQYSNASYQLLGILIEKITKQTLASTLSDLITGPLNLDTVYFPNSKQANLLKEYQDGKVSVSNFANAFAAGGLVSNAADLEKFIRHLFVIKDLLPQKQYRELTTFIQTPKSYYAFTGIDAPQFGLGVFRWHIPPYGDILNYPGVMGEGFTSAYTVIGDNVIISQSNTYNNNDFTLLWPHRAYTKDLLKYLQK